MGAALFVSPAIKKEWLGVFEFLVWEGEGFGCCAGEWNGMAGWNAS